jgi:pyridoxamine 5'-phosphate oxidase
LSPVAAPDPIAEFQRLFARAGRDAPFDVTAVTLATADAAGRPSARMVLVKTVDENGFCFFTNYESRKGAELAANPHAALCFHWPWIEEQVRVEGPVERASDEESDAYFASRPRGSQLGAWASKQSTPMPSRAALVWQVLQLEGRYFGRPVPRPPHWGGFRLRPERIELWHGRPDRLHERRLFVRGDAGWSLARLYP